MGVWGKGTAFESPCPARHCRTWVTIGFLRLSSTFLTHGFPGKLDAKSIVDQSVENAVGHGGIADLFMPVRDRQLLRVCLEITFPYRNVLAYT